MRDLLTACLLAPVLLGQAFFVRARIPQLPEPDGPRRGKLGEGKPLKLLIIGDSSAAGVGVSVQREALLGQVTQQLAQDFAVEFVLLAKTGACTRDAFLWLDAQKNEKFDVVVTAFGVNDVTKGTALPRFVDQQSRLIAQLRQAHAATLILVSGLPPVGEFPALPQPLRYVLGQRAGRFDQALEQLVAKRPGCEMVKLAFPLDQTAMAADGFHPGADVYQAWAARIAQVVKARLS